jgi:protein O-GlcNAc transferase
MKHDQPENAETHYNVALVLARQGRAVEAIDHLRQALRLKPDLAQPHYVLGILTKADGQPDTAIVEFREALRCQGDFVEAMHELADSLVQQNNMREAEGWYRQALAFRPDNAEIHHNLGFALQNQGRGEEAVDCYRQALRLKPDLAEVHFSLGTALQSLGHLDEAIACYRQTLTVYPTLADAHYNLGSALQMQGQLAEAIACYDQSLRINPNIAGAQFNLATALQSQGRLHEAVASYGRALLLDPNSAHAHNNLGLALAELGRMEEAVTCFRQSVRSKPGFAEAHSNLASALKERGQAAEAIACYQQAVYLEPGNPAFLSQLVFLRQQLCQWDGIGELTQQVIDMVAHPAQSDNSAAVDPLAFLGLPVWPTADQQRAAGICAHQWVQKRLQCAVNGDNRQVCAPRPNGSKITIGYLSADFHSHATAYLIAELIEKHNREHFGIFGFSYGPDDGSPMRQRLIKAFDRFVELGNASYQEAALRIRADEVDILVDLKGYTGHARPQILAHRPAPIQVNYLGYPGTMSAPFMDYVLVDDFVVPQDQQPFFTEKLVQLPGCYQVNDSQREIAADTPSRTACGLPHTGFVFCCFNNCQKITAQVFDVWMRILNAVPASVLWLLELNPFAPVNLRREAQASGVAPDRLVFAPRLPLPAHLARHRLADLFLDTVPYNAHTTASDALWAGCPVLTVAGKTFPSRVAGSLLRALELPELLTTSLREYEEMALRLAREQHFLDNIRARLAAKRETSPLFDGAAFARIVEKAYVAMWHIHNSGQAPRAFMVNP